MLKVNPEPLFTIDVEITVPGQKEPGSLSITFVYKNKESLETFWKEMEGGNRRGTVNGNCNRLERH